MRQLTRTALIAQPPERVYALIADVEKYPQFVPGCVGARIDAREPGGVIIATLDLKRGPLRASFTTRNVLDPPRTLSMQLVEGPFSELEGLWTLAPLGDSGCSVELQMKFAFANRVSGAMFEAAFAQIAGSLVDAFVQRVRSECR
jgi:ribosome-associated toxin RatA of RatAB toxin-antitoxin module